MTPATPKSPLPLLVLEFSTSIVLSNQTMKVRCWCVGRRKREREREKESYGFFSSPSPSVSPSLLFSLFLFCLLDSLVVVAVIVVDCLLVERNCVPIFLSSPPWLLFHPRDDMRVSHDDAIGT